MEHPVLSLNDRLFLSLAYRHRQRIADEVGSDFYENQAVIGISVVY